MFTTSKKKILIIASIAVTFVMAQTFAQKEKHDDEKPQNLKILPKDITGEELHKVMREYAMALGVHCNYCHVRKDDGDKHHMDFASDDKPEKEIARGMMKMTMAINEKYIDKIGDKKFVQVTCVTCHHGQTTPMVSVDSLPRRSEEKNH